MGKLNGNGWTPYLTFSELGFIDEDADNNWGGGPLLERYSSPTLAEYKQVLQFLPPSSGAGDLD